MKKAKVIVPDVIVPEEPIPEEPIIDEIAPVEEESIALVSIDRPTDRFMVQQAFRDVGITLVDVTTEVALPGLISVDSIGLSTGKPTVKNGRTSFGFLPVSDDERKRNEITISPPIEALLYFAFDYDGIYAGYNEELGVYQLVVQVINDKNVEAWASIALEVAQSLILEDEENGPQPGVIFIITSMMIPDSEEDHGRQ